jgi:hypothetical protein
MLTPPQFDIAGNTKSFEMSINDNSIFIPKEGVADEATRRADLLPSTASTLNDVATTGVKTMHFSIQQDASKPLNLTHDYQVTFLETTDFATHQFDVRIGRPAGDNIVVDGDSKTAGSAAKIFETPFVGVAGFQNFAVTMDFDAKLVTP